MPKEENPGKELKEFLIKIYPKINEGFLDRIDNDLMSDGDLSETFYFSCINYLLRRFINTAEYYRRQYPVDIYGEDRYRTELRKFFKGYTRYNQSTIVTLVNLLSRCLIAADKNLSDYDKRMVRRNAERHGHRCYICGIELDYQDNKSPNFPTVDHFWPRSMGGSDTEYNLRVCCQRCNNALKKDYIDANDYHFEEISLASISFDEFTKSTRRNHQGEIGLYEAAVYAKNEYKCVVCGRPAHRIGTLQVGRIDSGDSWHFLNLVAYCSEHLPEQQ